ncbi:MAG: hypothetical protein WCK11_01210 [Candidatus Falkowbacteria bacterium]
MNEPEIVPIISKNTPPDLETRRQAVLLEIASAEKITTKPGDVAIDFLNKAKPENKPSVPIAALPLVAQKPVKPLVKRGAWGNLIWIILPSISSFIILYSLWCLSLYLFAPTGAWVSRLSQAMPVPVIFSRYGVINYNEYLQIFNAISSTRPDNKQLAIKFAMEQRILTVLADEHGIAANQFNTPIEFINALAQSIITDREYNSLAFSKVLQVKHEVEQGIPLVTAAGNNELTAEQSTGTPAELVKQFGQSLWTISEGRISDVIVAGDGLYLVQLLGKSAESLTIAYVHVTPKTLEKVLADRYAQAKIINLLR